MPILMQRVFQRPTHNYSTSPVAQDLIFVHMMEGGYLGSVSWLCMAAAKASAHLCMSEDGSEVSQLVPLSMKAWAQCSFNGKGVSQELPGKTAEGNPEARWRAAALIVAWLCREYGLPPVWARGGLGRGVCQHADLGAAGGGHHDCSGVGSPTWLAFMAMAQQAFDAFGPVQLPVFALHGLPDHHQIILPPPVAPAPTHSGADRAEPGEARLPHPTSSGFAQGSMRDLQWRLRKVGANPQLDIDGGEGRATRAAFATFQRATGLPITSDVNPATLSRLYAMTSSA